MTEKDKTIQDLRRQVEGLKEELREIVNTTQNCRFCAKIHEDCCPGLAGCEPEWRGLREQ